jgi:CheY-like chemotaxis protein
MMPDLENDKVRTDAIGARAGGPTPANQPLSAYVLIVDDEPVVREFMARCLSGWGYAVQEAASADEAIDFMVAKPASVVLCDVKMPGHDGFWLADRLRSDWPGTPVVMASGIDDLQTIRHSRDLGAVDYISKPITPTQLREVLGRVLANQEGKRIPDDPALPPPELPPSRESQAEAEYMLESPVRCPACGERMTSVKAVRLVRAQVNFTSTLPRRGRVIVCPHCLAVISAELSNF